MTTSLDRVETLELPARLSAREPIEHFYGARDAVRLLVSPAAGGAPHHRGFIELPDLLEPGDVLVANDSATLAAALPASTREERVVVHLATRVAQRLWIVEPREPRSNGRAPLAEQRRSKLRGLRFTLAGGGRLEFLTPAHANSTRLWYAAIDLPNRDVAAYLAQYGTAIRYDYVDEIFPIADYQTIFARVPGSAEMPSAGRPFTPRTLEDLRARGIDLATITLHTGVSSPEAHEAPMAEWYAVRAETVRAIERTRAQGGRVIAIGTTVVRALESAARSGELRTSDGWTDHVVDRAHPPHIVDGILTGLHEPRASHLAMLESFLEPAQLAAAYREAIAHQYLWHEFGDVHLIA